MAIIDYLIKIISYKLINPIIDIVNFTKVVINILLKHRDFLEFIMSDKSSLFTLKFRFLL